MSGNLNILIDNSTANGLKTPYCSILYDNFLQVKLGIKSGKLIGETVFQFSHELMHCIYYSMMGLNFKQEKRQENICTAASLIMLKTICPTELYNYIQGLIKDNNELYKPGVNLAEEWNYDLKILRANILEDYPLIKKTPQL